MLAVSSCVHNWAASWQNQQNGMCAQRRLRSVWASAQSDQSLHWPSLIRVFAVRMKKAWVLSYPLSAQQRLIRPGGCPGWYESLLGAQSFCWFCQEAAQLFCGFKFYYSSVWCQRRLAALPGNLFIVFSSVLCSTQFRNNITCINIQFH